jgi:hypothetical protein
LSLRRFAKSDFSASFFHRPQVTDRLKAVHERIQFSLKFTLVLPRFTALFLRKHRGKRGFVAKSTSFLFGFQRAPPGKSFGSE